MNEKLTNYEEGREKTGVMMPISDRLMSPEMSAGLNSEVLGQVERRAELAREVCDTLDRIGDPRISLDEAIENGEIKEAEAEKLYGALAEILDDPDYARLALYVPFEVISSVGLESEQKGRFRRAYRDAWGDLLHVEDMRANFLDGDVFEKDARPEDPERVVKVVHLAPWLIKGMVIEARELYELATGTDDDTLKRSIKDVVPVMEEMGVLTEKELEEFREFGDSMPEAPKAKEPLFISENRKKWLENRGGDFEQPSADTPISELPDLSRPLYENIEGFRAEIEKIEMILVDNPELARDIYPAVFIGGSRVKGYGSKTSDIDMYVFTDADLSEEDWNRVREKFSDFELSRIKLIDKDGELDIKGRTKADVAHIAMDTVGVGDKKIVEDLQMKLLDMYAHEEDPEMRAYAIEKLEQDRLQYRLVHNGWPRLMPKYNPEYTKFPTIDGGSAFYDSGFRRVATKIFMRSVFIPKA